MFTLTALRGSPATRRQISGAVVAFAGLVWVLWPSGAWSANLNGALLMAAAGIGWALYTLAGRGAPDALAANFCLCLPLVLLMLLVSPMALNLTVWGATLAILSGAVTSGLGYALWYRLLPRLEPGVSATVQLSVPILALVAGVMLLGESATLRQVMGTVLVLGGIALSLRRPI